jgi:hypothetical protein
MAAEAAWVITTVIAAADKAIRIDIEETPNKGRKGSTDGKQLKRTQIQAGGAYLHAREDVHLSNICEPTMEICPDMGSMQAIARKLSSIPHGC